MHRFLTIALSLSLFFHHENGTASPSVPDPFSTSPSVLDPAGNLMGDASRSYLDLTELRLVSEASGRRLELYLAGPFPRADFMLGMGFRFDIAFLETRKSNVNGAPSPHLLQVRMGQDHWTWSLSSKLQLASQLESEIRIEANTRTLQIFLPEALFTGMELLKVSATTEEFPKWTPLTTHPSVTLPLGTDDPVAR